jgi:hypothetical protein
MSPTTNIPVVVQPDAAAYVAALGQQKELEQMIDHVRQTLPGVRKIDVELWPYYDPGDTDRVVILVMRDDPHLPEDPTGWELARWQVTTFPPEVCVNFCILDFYRPDHEG